MEIEKKKRKQRPGLRLPLSNHDSMKAGFGTKLSTPLKVAETTIVENEPKG